MNLVEIQSEIKKELGNKETFNTLVATTFKGLSPLIVPKAIMEGMMRGFTFSDFLKKNVYAVPFKDGYSLITSIDYARKIGMKSGIVGKSAPTFEEKENKIIACTITVKRKVDDYIGEYSATAYFDEYYKAGRNGYPSLWDSKPRTMISKVAEMHALRMACPEELAQSYVEEEVEAEIAKPLISIDENKTKLEAVKDLAELKVVWSSLPVEAKEALKEIKDNLKKKYENSKI